MRRPRSDAAQQQMVIADLEEKVQQAPEVASDEFMYQDKAKPSGSWKSRAKFSRTSRLCTLKSSVTGPGIAWLTAAIAATTMNRKAAADISRRPFCRVFAARYQTRLDVTKPRRRLAASGHVVGANSIHRVLAPLLRCIQSTVDRIMSWSAVSRGWRSATPKLPVTRMPCGIGCVASSLRRRCASIDASSRLVSGQMTIPRRPSGPPYLPERTERLVKTPTLRSTSSPTWWP